MTVHSQVSTFIPRDYEIFAGLDVDKHSIAVTFRNHEGLMQSLRLPYGTEQLLNYVRKHFPDNPFASPLHLLPHGSNAVTLFTPSFKRNLAVLNNREYASLRSNRPRTSHQRVKKDLQSGN
jgi:hypothetical protein